MQGAGSHIRRHEALKCPESSFPIQRGPQCKVHALSTVHHLLCECGNYPTYKNGNGEMISMRKIAKSCGSVVGEITSLSILAQIGEVVGLKVDLLEYADEDSFSILLDSAFKLKAMVIVFIQINWDDRYVADPEDDEEYKRQCYEHAVVAMGWARSEQEGKKT